MTDMLRGLDCKMWVDDVFYFAEDEISLLCLLDEVLGRLESVGLFVAAHKCIFFARELVWCGKVYSDGVVSHDPARIQGLSDMCVVLKPPVSSCSSCGRRTGCARLCRAWRKWWNRCVCFWNSSWQELRAERSGWRAIVSSKRTRERRSV